MNRQFIGTVLCAFVGLSGCAALQQKPQRDEAALQTIRKAAIVSFSVFQQEPVELSLDIGRLGLGANAGGSMIAKESAHSQQMYSNLSQTLKQNPKWQMIDLEKMTANPGYKKAYDKTMKGFQNKMPAGKNHKQYIVKDVMDWDSGRILGSAGRDELIQALGVDAIIVVRIDVNNQSLTVAGIGKRYPQASMLFETFVRGKESPVWRAFPQGEKATESVGWVGVFDKALMDKLAVESAKTAFDKLSQ